MTHPNSNRHTWAVELLNVQPSDRVLEIGCGHGIAVSLICDQLDTGTIIGMDRSETMVSAARKRNQDCIGSGRAAIQCASLDTSDFGRDRFNKIVAVNVSLFYSKDAAGALERVRQILSSGGMLTLVHQPPTASQTPDIADKLSDSLRRSGFTIASVVFKDMPPAPAVCIQAQP